MAEKEEWPVMEHGPLEQLAENLWRVEGALKTVSLRRHMLIARDDEGRLLIHNAICTDDATREKIEALGEATWLVVPNEFHRLDAARFKKRYSALKVFCPRGALKKVQSKVEVDATFDEWPEHPLFQVEHLDGSKEREGVWIVHSPDGVTLMFNDLVFNQPHLPGLFGFLYKAAGQSGKPKTSIVAKVLMLNDKAAFKAHLSRLAALEGLQRVIPGHIEPILENAAEVLQKVADEV